MLEMFIDSIRVSPMNFQRVLLLKEKDADRYLPIWIGPAEADAILIKLQDLRVPSPLTHDILMTVIDTLGGSLNHILVNDLQNDTFYAKITIQAHGESNEIYCRPSDAIALAVRAQVPIYAEESVLDKAGILLDKETGKPIIEQETQKETAEELTELNGEEELQQETENFATFAVSLESDEDGLIVASCPQLPGCHSQGRSRREAVRNIWEAIQGHIASMKNQGEEIPKADWELVKVDV